MSRLCYREAKSHSSFNQIDRLRRHSNLLQLQRSLGCLPLTPQELLSVCLSYIDKGARLGRELGSTVNHPCDFYSILAGHTLIEQYQLSCEDWVYGGLCGRLVTQYQLVSRMERG